jgi:hypothetical protein
MKQYEYIGNIDIIKHKSAYELTWDAYGNSDFSDTAVMKSVFYTKAQLLKVANGKQYYPKLREFVQAAIRDGVI